MIFCFRVRETFAFLLILSISYPQFLDEISYSFCLMDRIQVDKMDLAFFQIDVNETVLINDGIFDYQELKRGRHTFRCTFQYLGYREMNRPYILCCR